MARDRRSGAPHIGRITLGDRPHLVLAVSADSPGLRAAAARGVSLIEFRVDGLRSPQAEQARAVARALHRHRLPIIATVRSRSEGGQAPLTDAQRARLYASISPWIDAIDVELASVGRFAPTIAQARQLGMTVILSHHDFRAMPDKRALGALVERATTAGADIIKLAATATSSADVLRLFEFTAAHRARHLVTIAMGPLGSISRLLFPLAGSLLTYTNLSPAHGQIALDDFVAHLKAYYPAFAAATQPVRRAASARRSRKANR